MGQRATDTSAFSLADVVVPAANRLGEEGDGFKIAMQTLDFTRPGTAAGAVGSRRRPTSYAVEYARERVTFDVPIAMHQGVSFLIADMAAEIEAARLLVWQAAWMLDQGYGRKATLYSSFAKRFAADTAMKVTIDAVQVFGGYGYIKEYPVEKLMRDAKLFQIYEGTSQIQRLVIAREIFLPRGECSSGGELALERWKEAGADAGLAEPLFQARRLRCDRGSRLRADVLEQAIPDLAVTTLRPPTDNATFPPHGRACIAVAVEQHGPVRPEVPVSLLPAHRRRIERG